MREGRGAKVGRFWFGSRLSLFVCRFSIAVVRFSFAVFRSLEQRLGSLDDSNAAVRSYLYRKLRGRDRNGMRKRKWEAGNERRSTDYGKRATTIPGLE